MTRNSILGYFPYTLFQTLPRADLIAARGNVCLPPQEEKGIAKRLTSFEGSIRTNQLEM